jgi:hypothetical protein
MTKELVWASAARLTFTPGSFRDYYSKVYSRYQFPVDRFNVLSEEDRYGPPTKNIVPPPNDYNLNNLPRNEEYWYDRFNSLCAEMASFCYQQAGDRNIIIMYSGGTDSTAVLVSMMNHPKYREFLGSGRFKVCLNSFSIHEYPEMFYQYILPSIPIVATDYDKISADPNNFVISGDGGDYLICNTDVPVWEYNGTTDIFNEPGEIIYKYFDECDPSGAFSRMTRGIAKKAPFELETISQIYWWLGQCFTNQGEMCYPISWTSLEPQEMYGFDKYCRFFLHPMWTQFSFEYMSTSPVYNNLRDMRKFWKRTIIDYTKHKPYWNKNKVNSQRNIARKWYKSVIYGDGTWDSEAERFKT